MYTVAPASYTHAHTHTYIHDIPHTNMHIKHTPYTHIHHTHTHSTPTPHTDALTHKLRCANNSESTALLLHAQISGWSKINQLDSWTAIPSKDYILRLQTTQSTRNTQSLPSHSHLHTQANSLEHRYVGVGAENDSSLCMRGLNPSLPTTHALGPHSKSHFQHH